MPMLSPLQKTPSSHQGHEHQSLLVMASSNIPSTQIPTAQGLANTTAPSVTMPSASSVVTTSSTTVNLGQTIPTSSFHMSSYTANISTAPTPSNQLPGSLALRSAQMAQPLQLHMPPPTCTSRPPYEQLTPLPQATRKRTLPNTLPDMPPAQSQLKSLPSPKRRRAHTNTTVVSQVRSSSSVQDQNLIISTALDTIMDRLDEIELKLQTKLTEVCPVQTEDINRRNSRQVSEEALCTRQYAQSIISTVQGNLLFTLGKVPDMVVTALAAMEDSQVPTSSNN